MNPLKFVDMFQKRTHQLLLIIGLLVFTTSFATAQSKMLKKGDSAPLFKAKGSLAGKEFDFSLKKALSQGPVVLYFYPSAYTGGCDLEAHTFSEYHDQFEAAGATIIGISADNLKRLKKFSADPDFCAGKFPVASDPEGKIAAKYGLTISPMKSGARGINDEEINHGFIPRTTFVINSDGKIEKTFSSKEDQISPDEHVKYSLSIVKNL